MDIPWPAVQAAREAVGATPMHALNLSERVAIEALRAGGPRLVAHHFRLLADEFERKGMEHTPTLIRARADELDPS